MKLIWIKKQEVRCCTSPFYEYHKTAMCMPDPTHRDELVRRLTGREGQAEWASTPKEVWLQVWQRKHDLFEPPTLEEGFDAIHQKGDLIR